jgi:hypothetical protein
MSEFKYPIYKQSKHSGVVIEFQNLNCGKVVFQGDSNFEVGYFGSHWENHTNLGWIDVKHIYQKTVSDEKTSIPHLEMCGTSYNIEEKQNNKYKRKVPTLEIDVYDILKAFNVVNPATQHAVKKLLCAGFRKNWS